MYESREGQIRPYVGNPFDDYLRELGATLVVYGKVLVERVRAVAPDGIDAVSDIAGTASRLNSAV